MKIQDALNILGLSGEVTLEACREAYRRASMKYHPDRNPGGLEMMQAVNAAWAFIQSWDFSRGVPTGDSDANYGDALNAAINALVGLQGLSVEVCGAWLWVSGNTYPHKAALKESGFMWASKKKQWYFRPAEWSSANRYGEWQMDDIRRFYGSEKVEVPKQRSAPQLAMA